jgi:hypothetical protein
MMKVLRRLVGPNKRQFSCNTFQNKNLEANKSQQVRAKENDALEDASFQAEFSKINQMIEEVRKQDPNYTPPVVIQPNINKLEAEQQARQQESSAEDDNAAVWSNV